MNPTSNFNDQYQAQIKSTRAHRMQWWHEARFGMFVHWGLYSQLARHEWVMNRERIPVAEYEQLAATWKPKPGAARQWAALAKRAGMKYMVLTTKHHEGFLLWDSQLSDYTAVRRGPGRDLVREYVAAAREFGLRVGFYHSLMDWHHPDGAKCFYDGNARRRFLDYTQGCLRELMSHYGKIDILWYDVPWPLSSPEQWESNQMNAMVRGLQPHIIINDRSQTPEDFGTPEEHITAATAGRAWEACLTFNGAWGWQPTPPADWHSARAVVNMLQKVTAGAGNLLLNVGPKPDGTLPAEAVDRLTAVGRWLKKYGAIVYGKVDRVEDMDFMVTGSWSRRGRTLYYWCSRWPGRELTLGGLSAKLRSVRLHPAGKLLPFTQTENQLCIRGLPAKCPDSIVHIAPLELKFRAVPKQLLGFGHVSLTPPQPPRSKWISPYIETWQLSKVLPKKPVRSIRLASQLGWQPVHGQAGFINIHDKFGAADGIVYLANRFRVAAAGTWKILLGHDGGAQLFVDGQRVLHEPNRLNPAQPGRSHVTVALAKGTHEIVIAFDLDHGYGWGIFFQFEQPKTGARPVFPTLA